MRKQLTQIQEQRIKNKLNNMASKINTIEQRNLLLENKIEWDDKLIAYVLQFKKKLFEQRYKGVLK